MGQIIAYTNNENHPVTIGNKTIQPGATREVDETLLPTFRAPAAAPAQPELSLVEQALAGTAKEAIELIGQLDDEQLAALLETEQASSKTRKSLVEAISKEQLERAQREELDDELKAFVADLASEDDAALAELAELHADDDHLLVLIRAEIDRRAAAAG